MRRRKSGLAEEVSSIWRSQIVRYVFFGGMTTFVNLGVYFVLRGIFFLSVTVSNIISVSSAVLFAYLVNSFFVFESRPNTWVTRGDVYKRQTFDCPTEYMTSFQAVQQSGAARDTA